MNSYILPTFIPQNTHKVQRIQEVFPYKTNVCKADLFLNKRGYSMETKLSNIYIQKFRSEMK